MSSQKPKSVYAATSDNTLQQVAKFKHFWLVTIRDHKQNKGHRLAKRYATWDSIFRVPETGLSNTANISDFKWAFYNGLVTRMASKKLPRRCRCRFVMGSSQLIRNSPVFTPKWEHLWSAVNCVNRWRKNTRDEKRCSQWFWLNVTEVLQSVYDVLIDLCCQIYAK